MGFLADYHVPREPNSVTGYGLSLPDSTYVTQTIIIETLARKGPCHRRTLRQLCPALQK